MNSHEIIALIQSRRDAWDTEYCQNENQSKKYEIRGKIDELETLVKIIEERIEKNMEVQSQKLDVGTEESNF
jgi:hypothetical protein